MILALAILLPTILGLITMQLILRNDHQLSFLEMTAYAYPIGIGLVTYQMFILGIFRVPLQLPFVLIIILAEIGVLAFCMYGSRWSHPIMPDFITSRGFSKGRGILFFVEIVAVVWVGIKLGTVLIETYLRPIQAWDAWANWSARAKVFYYSHSLLLDVPSSDILGKGVIDANSNYPLMNAMAQVWMALWAGNFDEVLVKFWIPFFLLSATLHLFIIGMREMNRLLSLLIIILFLSSPLMSLHATETYSDLALAVYALFALSSFLQVIRGESRHLPLIGIFCTLAMFTKDEGLFFAVPLLLSCCVFLWKRSDGISFRKEMITCCSPCLLILPWLFCKFYFNLGMGADYIEFALTFRPDIMLQYVIYMSGLMNFNILFIFIPVMLVLYNKSNITIAYLTFPVAAYALFFVCLYGFTTFFSQNVHFSTGIFRNTLTYYPSCFLLAILLIKDTMNTARQPAIHNGFAHPPIKSAPPRRKRARGKSK
jgi:hypothetical protein